MRSTVSPEGHTEDAVFEIVKNSGSGTKRILGTPLFVTESEALAYAAYYVRSHSEEFRAGQDGCGARLHSPD